MPKVECTAVNELVDLARTKPLDSDDGDADLFGGFDNQARAVRLRGTPAPSLFEMPALPPPPAPVPQPVQAQPSRQQQAQHAARAIAIAPLRLGSDDSATSHVARYVPLSTLGRRFGLPVAGLVGLGILTGIAYTHLAHHGSSASASPTTVALAAEAAAPPIIVAPLAPAAPAADTAAPKLVDVRLDSAPAGATATLLSNGVSTPLGTTPVDTSIDPTKQYDVVFALAGKPSQVEHFDPSKTQRVQVVFPDAPAPAADALADAKPVKSSSHHHAKHAQAARVATASSAPARSTKSSKSMPSLATPDFGDSPASTKSSSSSNAGDGGNGSLAITSSAPAAILLDDSNTGFMTPHTLSVPAGHHNIRLIAATAHVNKLVQVDISAHKTTRINPF